MTQHDRPDTDPTTGPDAGPGAAVTVDVDALHATADTAATVALPTDPGPAPAADAVGDGEAAAALQDFLDAYRQVLRDLTADLTATAPNLHDCADTYRDTETRERDRFAHHYPPT